MDRTRNRSSYSYNGRDLSGARSKRYGNSLISYAVMAVLVVFFSLTLPLAVIGSSLTKGVAWVACLACAGMVVFTSRQFSSVLLVSLVFTFVISSLGEPTLPAIVFGVIMSSGIYSAAIAAAKKMHIAFIISAPLLTLAVAYVFTSDIAISAMSIAYLIPATVMGLASRKKISRSYSIAVYALVSVVLLGCGVLLYVFAQNGRLTSDVIEYAVEYLRAGIEWTLRNSIESAGAVEINNYLIIQIREMATATVNLLPGIVAIIALTVGFFVQKINCSIFNSYGKDDLFEIAAAPISASLAAALTFVATHVLSYTSGASHAPSFLAVAAENISLILLPALLCVGFEVMAVLPRKVGFLALIIWIGAVLIANLLTLSILTVIALIGAFYIFFVRTDDWAKRHYAKKGEDQ